VRSSAHGLQGAGLKQLAYLKQAKLRENSGLFKALHFDIPGKSS